MRSRRGALEITFLGALAASAVPIVAYCKVYLSEDQAVAAIFPGVKLTPSWIELTPAQVSRIESLSGERVRGPRLRVWKGPKGETVFIDQVVGKHEFIPLAVGIEKGKVKGIEILEYRETYGGDVRRPEWRAQFVGKDAAAPLKVDKDIRNISGATLSSTHVAGGVRRLLRTYEVLGEKS